MRPLSASTAAALGALLTASVLHAQSLHPAPNPIEVVYSTNSSARQILRLDFATGTSTVVNTDARLRKRLDGLAARNDGSTVHLLVSDSKRGEVLFYENAAGTGQVITTGIPSPDSVSLDLAGNAYVLGSARGADDDDDDDRSRAQVWMLPRLRSGLSGPGGYGTPVLIDGELPSRRLEDTRVVPFTAGQLRRGDLLVLSSRPAAIFRYQKLDCAPGDTACTGFGPREVFVPETAFPRGSKPAGFAFAPNLDLLVSGQPGAILRYNPDGRRVQPDFASGRGTGRSRIVVGVQEGRNYAFVANRGEDDDESSSIQRFIINENGTGTLDATVSDNVRRPEGIGLGSGQAAPTPTGAGVVAVPAPESALTFDNVERAGLSTARIIEFEDNRLALQGAFEADQNLKDFFPAGSPLRNELPNVIIPAHVQAFRKGDPITGTPTFLLAILDSTAAFSRTVEVRYEEEDQLGYQPSCTDPDPALQPRTFYAPEIDPPKSKPPIVEGPEFTDFSTGCGSNIGRSGRFSLWLTARDTRDLPDIVDIKLANMSAALAFHPCIDPATRGRLEQELQAAGAAFDAYKETGDAAQQVLAIARLDAFIAAADSNSAGFAACDASVNVRGELIARAESAKFMTAKVVIASLIVTKHVVNNNGGTAVASDFTMTVTRSRGGPTRFRGAEGGTRVGLVPGAAYSVSESGPSGYSPGFSTDCASSVAAGDVKTCTVTNDDIPPSLTLVKVVTNNNGGTATVADFTLSAFGPTPISGAGGASSGGTFHQGTYTLSETGPLGYAASAWTCAGGTQVGNQITLGLGQSATCTIINDDIPPVLTLVKQVINNSGGTAVAAAFTLSASGPTPISGAGGTTSGGTFSAGTYTLSETGPLGYSASAWSCAGATLVGGNQIALALGQSATCTITNDDIPAGPPPNAVTASFFGGPGDQRGSNIHRDGADLYVSGTSGNTALLLRYGIPLGSPAWSATLPPNTYFEGVTLSGSTLFGVGGALPPTCGASDGAGGTEHKSGLGRFTTTGLLLGCQSTNYFPYRGGEGYSDAVASAGSVYAVGGAENFGFGDAVFVLSKFDAGGTLLATATEPGAGSRIGNSNVQAVTELNGALYLAGQSNLRAEDGFGSFARPVLMRYDTALSRQWKRRPADYPAGEFLGVAPLGSHVYAVGYQYVAGAANSQNYLIEKYDELGNRVWSRISGGALNDVLTGVVAWGTRLFAVGYTYSSGAGGADAVILEIDPATGDTLSTTLFGGTQDDLAQDVVTDGTALYVVGESRSFANAGNAVGQNDVMILRYVPGP